MQSEQDSLQQVQQPSPQSTHQASSSLDALAKEEAGPWYKEFWAWFVFSPLIIVIISCSITVTIAVRNSDDRVVDDYYKEGRMINMRMDEFLLAENLDVLADLNFDTVVTEVTLKLAQNQEAFPQSIELLLDHPAHAEKDQRIILKHIADNAYRGDLVSAEALNHRWYIRLRSQYDDQEILNWRLSGVIDFANGHTIQIDTEK